MALLIPVGFRPRSRIAITAFWRSACVGDSGIERKQDLYQSKVAGETQTKYLRCLMKSEKPAMKFPPQGVKFGKKFHNCLILKGRSAVW
jgi:hypothetical protein